MLYATTRVVDHEKKFILVGAVIAGSNGSRQETFIAASIGSFYVG